MPALSTSDLSRFFNYGEVEVSNDRPFLVDRYSPTLVAGQATYELPNYVRSIKRVTYLGQMLDPLPRRAQRDAFQPATQQGQPFWYVYNNIGLNNIQLFPVPQVALAAATSGTEWSTGIATACIVEFWRISDNDDFIIPTTLRRQLLKRYVAKQAYSIDGPNLNMKLSKYYSDQWDRWKLSFNGLLDTLISKPRKLNLTGIDTYNYFPGAPVLPISRFGISVDTGE